MVPIYPVRIGSSREGDLINPRVRRAILRTFKVDSNGHLLFERRNCKRIRDHEETLCAVSQS
jgi:hypothetical protein